jgi:hypothetical protein
MLIAAIAAIAAVGLVILVVAVRRAPKGSEDSQGFHSEEPQVEPADGSRKPASAKGLRSKGTA